MAILFPGLPDLPWKAVDLQREFLDRKYPSMKDVEEQHRLLWELSEEGRYRTYGGFGEDRSQLWAGFETHGQPMIHLGVDFNNLPVCQPVGALEAGRVIHVFRDASSFNGWGGRVMVQSQNDTVLLYGHLQFCSLPETGDQVQQGQIIGYVASDQSNGGWFPHLHLQRMTRQYVDSFPRWTLIDGYAAEVPEGILDPMTLLPSFGNTTLLK